MIPAGDVRRLINWSSIAGASTEAHTQHASDILNTMYPPSLSTGSGILLRVSCAETHALAWYIFDRN